jgi:molybdate transport system substrate-binding protein
MELRVLGAGAAKGAVQALQAEFLSSTGGTVKASFGAVSTIKEQLDAGAACDVVILTAQMLDDLQAQGRLVAGTIAALGRVETGIAVRTGETFPAISERNAFGASLKRAKAIYLPDPVRSTAGIHFVSVLKKLDIFGDMEAKLRFYPNGALAMTHLSQTTELEMIGCTQVTEILCTEGVSLVGLLPKEFELSTVYSAAISRNPTSLDLAHRFIELLTGSQTKKLRVDGGFNV